MGTAKRRGNTYASKLGWAFSFEGLRLDGLKSCFKFPAHIGGWAGFIPVQTRPRPVLPCKRITGFRLAAGGVRSAAAGEDEGKHGGRRPMRPSALVVLVLYGVEHLGD